MRTGNSWSVSFVHICTPLYGRGKRVFFVTGARRTGLMSGISRLDLWIVQLEGLIKHTLEIRDTNVMGYKRNAKKAFEMGLNMLVLLMKNMIEDMVAEKNE